MYLSKGGFLKFLIIYIGRAVCMGWDRGLRIGRVVGW